MTTEKCVKCGSELAPEQNFCPACGEPRPPKITCKKCGAELKHGQAFCPNCGAATTSDTDSPLDSSPSSIAKKSIPPKMFLFAGAILIIVLAIALKFAWPQLSSIIQTFKESEDLQVTCTHIIEDCYGAVAVRNTGEKAIRDYEIVYVLFDANGINIDVSISETIFGTYAYSSANILPGDIYGWDMGYFSTFGDNRNVRYMEATVSRITYTDGSIWEAQGLTAWANETVKNFSVEAYKQKIENMESDSKNAENNPYVQVIANRISTTHSEDDLELVMKNISGKDITALSLYITQYDQNGYGVDGYIRKVVKGHTLSNGNTYSYSSSMFFSTSTKYQKVIVSSLEFSDGTVWNNPYAPQWSLYNVDMR